MRTTAIAKYAMALAAGALLAVACGKGAPEQATDGAAKPAAKAAPKALTAEEVLLKAAEVTLNLKSVQFSLAREGKPAYLDEKTSVTFTGATCRYQAPDRAGSIIKVGLPNGSQMQLEKVWVPEGIFMTNPLTKAFNRAPAYSVFNVVTLFKEEGIPGLLRTGVTKGALAGKDKIEGRDNFHVTGEAEGKKVAPLMADTVSSDVPYPFDLWIDAENYHVNKMHITLPGGNGFLIEMFAFNEPVEVKTPEVKTYKKAE